MAVAVGTVLGVGVLSAGVGVAPGVCAGGPCGVAPAVVPSTFGDR